jgi:transposase InsO family protein
VLADGRRFRVLVIVDDFTRECMALVVDTSISGRRVARELDAIIAARRKPLMIVSVNGTALTSHAILHWQRDAASDGTTSRPENRFRTPLSKASTVASGTSAATNISSGVCR